MIPRSVAPKTRANQPSNKNMKLPKFLEIFFIFYQVLFSFDLGFLRCKRRYINYCIKFAAILKSFIFCFYFGYLFFNVFKIKQALYYTVYNAQYFLDICFITLPNDDTSLYTFFNTLLAVDKEMRIVIFNTTGYKIIFSILISVFARCVLIIIFCFTRSANCMSLFNQVLYTVLPITYDSILVIYTLIFYCSYCRLTKLTAALKIHDTDITSSQYLYITIIDITEKVKSRFDNVVSVKF